MTDSFRHSGAPIAVLLLLGLSVSLLGCGAEEGTPPPVPTGTYDLTIDRGRDVIRATVQLVEGVDGTLWGHARIRRDELLDSGIGTTNATSDSVSFTFFRDNRLTLPTTGALDTDPLTGSARINDTLYTAKMQRQSAAERLGPPVNSFYTYEYAARVSPSSAFPKGRCGGAGLDFRNAGDDGGNITWMPSWYPGLSQESPVSSHRHCACRSPGRHWGTGSLEDSRRTSNPFRFCPAP